MGCHQSNYGAGGLITAPQKMSEVICERIAAHEGVGLASQFWKESKWKREFGRQVQAANRLLKLYDADVIFRVLAEKPQIRSLAPLFVADLVADCQKKVDAEIVRAEKTAPIQTNDTSVAPRQGVSRSESVANKLKGL